MFLTISIVIGLFLTVTTASQAAGLPLGMNDLSADPAQMGFWQRLAPNQGGPCLAPQINGAGPDTWHYGQSTTNLQNSPVCNYNNGARNFGGLLSPTFSSATVPVLHFDSFLDVEPGSGYDIADVQLSVDSGMFTRIILINKARMNLWDSYDTGLAACAGHTCQLKFFFDTMDSTSNNTRGWYIANFSITAPSAATSTPTSTSTLTPTSTATNTSTPTSTPTDLGVTITEDDCVGGSVYILNSGPTARNFRVKVTFNGPTIVDQSNTVAAGSNTTVGWTWPIIGGSHQSLIDVWRDNSVNIAHNDLTVFCPPTPTPTATSTSTNTPVNTSTSTRTSPPTNTPTPTKTLTARTVMPSPTPTSTPTVTSSPTVTLTPTPLPAHLVLFGYLPFSAVTPGTDFEIPFFLGNDGDATAVAPWVVNQWEIVPGGVGGNRQKLTTVVNVKETKITKSKGLKNDSVKTVPGENGSNTLYFNDLEPGGYVWYALVFRIAPNTAPGNIFQITATANTQTFQADKSLNTWSGQMGIVSNQFHLYLPLILR